MYFLLNSHPYPIKIKSLPQIDIERYLRTARTYSFKSVQIVSQATRVEYESELPYTYRCGKNTGQKENSVKISLAVGNSVASSTKRIAN